jgi:hypothetical protein
LGRALLPPTAPQPGRARPGSAATAAASGAFSSPPFALVSCQGGDHQLPFPMSRLWRWVRRSEEPPVTRRDARLFEERRANLFLDDVDRMLEQAQSATPQGDYEVVRYTRFADDLAVLPQRSSLGHYGQAMSDAGDGTSSPPGIAECVMGRPLRSRSTRCGAPPQAARGRRRLRAARAA